MPVHEFLALPEVVQQFHIAAEVELQRQRNRQGRRMKQGLPNL